MEKIKKSAGTAATIAKVFKIIFIICAACMAVGGLAGFAMSGFIDGYYKDAANLEAAAGSLNADMGIFNFIPFDSFAEAGKYGMFFSVQSLCAAGQGADKVTLAVAVQDTGIGIKEEDMANLFQPFDRLDQTKNRNIEGTGLGLNIADKYIHMMGGRIEVSSVYGEGSLFTAFIPLGVIDGTPIGDFTDVVRDHREEGAEHVTEIIAPNARALVVDDNEMNLEVIAGLMECTQIRVDTALSGHEGIERMENKRYDIIFLDQMMPGMDGVATLQAMRSRFDMRGVSVIALTADAVVGAREFYLEKGFDDYLSKPVKSEALEKMLIKHLPDGLLLSAEDIARISKAEEQRRLDREKLKSVIVVDNDTDSLKEAKKSLDGIYKGTFVKDTDKARTYLEKHDADYVMVKKDIYLDLAASPGNVEKHTLDRVDSMADKTRGVCCKRRYLLINSQVRK